VLTDAVTLDNGSGQNAERFAACDGDRIEQVAMG